MAARTVSTSRRPFYGWAIVFTLSLTETTSFGILYYAFSVFLPSIERELGWSRAQTTGAFSLALLLSGLAAIPAGRWLDRRGGRALMTAGSVAATVLVLAWSQVRDLGAFYLIWAGIGLSMAAVLYEPAFAIITQWFVRDRQRAFTVMTFIAGLASLIFNPLGSWLIDVQGWRAALVTLALMLGLLTILPHALVRRRRPADLGLQPDGAIDAEATRKAVAREVPSVALGAAFRTATFWALNGALILTTLASITIGVHLIPFLIGRGYETGFAALAVGLIGLMQLPGRLLFVPLGGHMSRRTITICLALMQSVALAALLLMDNLPGVLLFVALFGMANGMLTLARASLVVEFFGPAYYGSINGWVGFFTVLARAAAPLGAGLMFTAFNSYSPVLWTLIGASTGAALCFYLAEIWWARRGATKVAITGG